MKVAFRTLLVSAAASVLSLTSGCSESVSPVVGPEAASPAGRMAVSGKENPNLAPLAHFRKKPQVTIAWAKKWIGPAGGRLEFQGFAIDVPAGAVGKVTQFSIRLPVDPNGSERVHAEFGPHGSTFRVPVAIELPFQGTSVETDPYATVVWWDGARNGWVDMGGGVTADGLRLRTTTTHFSIFGTTNGSSAMPTDDRGGTLGSGG